MNLKLIKKIKRVLIAPEVMMNIVILGVKHYEVVEGLPITCSYYNCSFDSHTGLINLYILDDSFEPIPLGNEIPVFTPIIERRNGHTN